MSNLLTVLDRLRRRAGGPSYREISRRTDGLVSHTAAHTVLSGDVELPRWSTVMAVAQALGATPEELVHLRDLWDAEQERLRPVRPMRRPRVTEAATVRPGDTLVFTIPEVDEHLDLDTVQKQMTDMFPENNVIVLAGAKLAVVKREETA